MAKKIVAIMVIAIMLFGVFGLTACNNEHKIYEEGFFQYIIVGENSRSPDKNNKAVVAIVGFTESGKEQNAIDFPRVINGKDVKYIGYRNYSTFMDSFYHLESTNLKKVYIYENITSIYSGAFVNWIESGLDIMICAARNYSIDEMRLLEPSRTYIYKDIYDALDENSIWLEDKQAHTFSKGSVQSANITFLNNYSDEINGGYYKLDNIESGEKIQQPSDPERAGYNFIGWFTESNCESIWDFNNTKKVADGDEFRLYAGWQQK